MADATYPLFPVMAFIGFIISLIPLPWHVQAWNSGTCAFMLWTSVTCFIKFINAVIWRGNLYNVAPTWCDISSKLLMGVSVGIPASTLCISRRLYNITSVQSVCITLQDKRRMVIGDLCIAFGIPVLVMILHVVVQPHRFDILEDVGCYPVVYNTIPAYPLVFMWPIVLGVASFCYSVMTLRSFYLRRLQFTQLIASHSAMNVSRYLRLMLLAILDICLTLPLAIYSVYISPKGVPLAPWISWAETHFNFGRVGLIPAVIWRTDPYFRIAVELTQWLPVLCAFMFFGLFGFALEARKQYTRALSCIVTCLGLKSPSFSTVTKTPLSDHKKGSNADLLPSPPIYQPKFPGFKKDVAGSATITTGDYQLSSYTYDAEKSAGLSPTSSDPPEYFRSDTEYHQNSEAGTSVHPSPHFSRCSLDLQADPDTKRSRDYQASIYISDSYHNSTVPFPRSPSPAPFADIMATPPSSLNLNPFTPISHARSLDAIRITVHTQTRSESILSL